MPPLKKPPLRAVNCFLMCAVCRGYLIDATTVSECFHTFCRSCIVRHLRKSQFCPVCDVQIDTERPVNKLRPDPRKQLLVYKMVPGLYQKEMQRRLKFKKRPGKKAAYKPVLPSDLKDHVNRDRIVDSLCIYHPKENVSMSLEYDWRLPNGIVNGDAAEKQIHKRYLNCPAGMTIGVLKKFLRNKYDVGNQYGVVVRYEGDVMADFQTILDVAYQYFWERKAPMRFTYRFDLRPVTRRTEQVPNRQKPVVAPAPSPPPPPAPAPSAPAPAPAKPSRPTLRGSVTSNGSADEGSGGGRRRELRQRTAKTAACTAMQAMEEDGSDHEEDQRAAKRRRSFKSPRWEDDDSSFSPFTPRTPSGRTPRGRTPRASGVDADSRYNRTVGKRVYSFAGMDDDDESSSDAETKRNTIANSRSCRKKAADIYDFPGSNNDDTMDSNSTQEFDFVYDDNNSMEPEGEKAEEPTETEAEQPAAVESQSQNADQVLDEDDHDFDQHIEMEEIIEHVDIEQRIEDSIEEVEVDAEDSIEKDTEEVQEDDDMHTETASSSCLVIAEEDNLIIAEEEDDDDGVVEEVIAAEESGHELVVVEEPECVDMDSTSAQERVHICDSARDASKKSKISSKHEEDEPEIVHEKVMRKKSKKAKHHHHHHKHKHRHSPVQIVSSPDEDQGGLKLTLKLRPTPSISPGSSSTRTSNKSPQPDSRGKRNSVDFPFPNKEVAIVDPVRRVSVKERSSKTPSPKAQTGPFFFKTPSPRADSPEIKSPTPEPLSPKSSTPEPVSEDRCSPKVFSPSSESTSMNVARPPTPSSKTTKVMEVHGQGKRPVPDDVKERLLQMRAVRHKSIASGSPSSPPAASQATTSSNLPDLKAVKTPSSLIISKVEAGEVPPRPEEVKRPALEILMLPPSPPPKKEEAVRSPTETTIKKKNVPAASPALSSLPPSKPRPVETTTDQTCVLDLSGKTNREVSKFTVHSGVSPVPKPQISPLVSPIAVPSTSPKHSPDQGGRNGGVNVARPQDLGLIPNSSLIAISNFMNMAAMFPNKGMGQKVPALTQFMPQQSATQRSRPIPALNDLYPNKRVGGFSMPTQPARSNSVSTSRPGPNQAVRQIPNPSALFQRQQQILKQQELTEQQLKERLQQFQNNQRAATGVVSMSSLTHSPGIPSSLQTPSNNIAKNNNIMVKGAIRSRSIEKVAAGLSVRAGVPLEAYAAQ